MSDKKEKTLEMKDLDSNKEQAQPPDWAAHPPDDPNNTFV
jgi:hypothetical protein